MEPARPTAVRSVVRWSPLLVLAACTSHPVPDGPPLSIESALHVPPVWPEPGTELVPPVIEVPDGFGPETVFLVAGHGAPGNDGNLGSACTREQDFTLDATERLADLLDATGVFTAVRARRGAARPTYRARVAHLERSGATAMIELHSDARADAPYANAVSPDGETCWRDDGEPGFTVLVRTRGAAKPLADERLALARSLARALTDAGFPPWVGDNYGSLYDADDVPGVWLDRRNLFMLRTPKVPSVIVETHNAMDGREVVRWEEDDTHDVFGRAVISGLLSFYAD